MFTLKQINHLNAIIKHKSIHKAADALHLSQPAMTRSISKLELAIGVTLFDRTKSGMQPTPFCCHIQQRCQQLSYLAQDLKREAKLHNNLSQGTLHIGCGRAIHELLVRRVVPEFVCKHPGLNVDISAAKPEDLLQGLNSRELDFCLAGSGSFYHADNLTCVKIADFPLRVLVGSQHALANNMSLQFSQILPYPMISSTTITPSHPLTRHLNPANLNNVVVCSDYTTLKQILLTSECWLLAPYAQYRDEIIAKELVVLEFAGFSAQTELSLIELTGRSRSPAMTAFVDLCCQQFG